MVSFLSQLYDRGWFGGFLCPIIYSTLCLNGILPAYLLEGILQSLLCLIIYSASGCRNSIPNRILEGVLGNFYTRLQMELLVWVDLCPVIYGVVFWGFLHSTTYVTLGLDGSISSYIGCFIFYDAH